MSQPRDHIGTKAVHHGNHNAYGRGPVVAPIVQSATFQYRPSDIREGRGPRDVLGNQYYTRYGNPTLSAAEGAIAALEGGQEALLFGSGMCALTTAILSLVKAGDHVVAQRQIYGGAYEFIHEWLPRFGVETTLVDAAEPEGFAAAIRPNTRLIHVESPSNPTLRVVDLARVAALGRERGILTSIDSTSASPINQRPIEFGIDIVLHSATKYLAGHSDIIAGVAVGSRDFIRRLREEIIVLGGVIDPHAAWLLARGIKTLEVRVERQNETGLRLAEFLEKHPGVSRVNYPFLSSHPQHALARRQMKGGGGLLSFELNGTPEQAQRFSGALRLFALAPSLGGVESLVTIPAVTSHIMLSPEERRRTGVTDTLVRLAVGIENADDLVADVDRALRAVLASQDSDIGNAEQVAMVGTQESKA